MRNSEVLIRGKTLCTPAFNLKTTSRFDLLLYKIDFFFSTLQVFASI